MFMLWVRDDNLENRYEHTLELNIQVKDVWACRYIHLYKIYIYSKNMAGEENLSPKNGI